MKQGKYTQVNDSNIQILNKNLLSFDTYEKEIIENLFNKCNDNETRNFLIKEQKKVIKKLFNIQYLYK